MTKRIFKHCFCISLLLLTIGTVQAANVQLVGLFPGSAIMLIDGKRRLMKIGQQVGSVKLLSTTAQQVVALVDGEQKTFSLSREKSNGFTEAPEKPTVKLVRKNDGHYWTTGKINGRAISMMVDTGASDISLSETDAKKLNIPYRHGKPAVYSTANGKVRGYQITLASVTVKGITLRNVQASVIPSNHPVLLGMSFLREVDMREKGNILYLVPRY